MDRHVAPLRGVDPALNAVKEAVQELPQREDVHSETGLPVLRLKTPRPDGAGARSPL